MNRYDAIVIGAGQNGLACACYLAKAGLSVLLGVPWWISGGETARDWDEAKEPYADHLRGPASCLSGKSILLTEQPDVLLVLKMPVAALSGDFDQDTNRFEPGDELVRCRAGKASERSHTGDRNDRRTKELFQDEQCTSCPLAKRIQYPCAIGFP